MEQTRYGYRVISSRTYQEAVEATKSALQKEGFGVLTEIDVKETIKKKLNLDFRKYVILGACNPPLAYQALNTETEIGLLLPCNVIVYEGEAGKTVVSAINPVEALKITGRAELNSLAAQVSEKLKKVIASLE